MHTILGSNGTIGNELSKQLINFTENIRQVSRHPKKVNNTDQLMVADLLNSKATSEAVAGSEVVYLVAGLPYKLSVWQQQWPVVMHNVINACKEHNARLVFFDNVYCYGYVEGIMTEETPFNPSSKKGDVRAEIANMLLNEMQTGNITAMIARSADFYGPDAVLSFPYATVFQRLKVGKSPQWLGKAEKIHTFTYTPDAGKALAVLAQSEKAWGQTWHLPTSKELLTAKDFVRIACDLAGQAYQLQIAPDWLMKIMGWFIPVIRENEEMMYQLNNDYHFDSSKIELAYDLKATAYKDGIAKCLE